MDQIACGTGWHLSCAFHWMFDRGRISIDSDYGLVLMRIRDAWECTVAGQQGSAAAIAGRPGSTTRIRAFWSTIGSCVQGVTNLTTPQQGGGGRLRVEELVREMERIEGMAAG